MQERLVDWSARFGALLGLNCVEMTGDTATVSWSELAEADIMCVRLAPRIASFRASSDALRRSMTTPEKLDSVTRRAQGGLSFLSDIALFCIDEVHILNDERGPALEAVVSRLKLLSRLPSLAGTPLSRLRFVAVSATIPNVSDVGAWLGAPRGFSPSFGDEYRACALEVKVHGYNAAKSDFLFERCAWPCVCVPPSGTRAL